MTATTQLAKMVKQLVIDVQEGSKAEIPIRQTGTHNADKHKLVDMRPEPAQGVCGYEKKLRLGNNAVYARMNLLHGSQRPIKVIRNHRGGGGQPHESQLQKGVVFADCCRPHLGRGQRKVPVSHKGLGWRQGDPPVVYG